MTLERPPFDAVTAYGISAMAMLISLYAFWLATRRAQVSGLKSFLAIALLLGASGGAAASGVFLNFSSTPPPFFLIIALVVILPLAVGFSTIGSRLASELSIFALVASQGFRFPLELLMHNGLSKGIVPSWLTFSGYNFDIATGIAACTLAILMSYGKVPILAVWAFNVLGIVCLAVIAVIAIAGSPLVRAFGDAPADINTWVLCFPYVWLPLVLVSFAITLHIVLTRKLLRHGALANGKI